MPQSLPLPLGLLGIAAVVSLAAACATVPPPASAQGNTATNIPVLVVSEDEDPNTVKRSSTIFKRVIAELQGAMQRHGFRMIDEESVAPERPRTRPFRRPGSEGRRRPPAAGNGAIRATPAPPTRAGAVHSS